MPVLLHALNRKPAIALVGLRHSVLVLSFAFLAACGTVPAQNDAIDCSLAQTSCHMGRFVLVWKTQDAQGQTEGHAVSGNYEWRSLRAQDSADGHDIALLEVRSALGPTLGSAKRNGNFYEVRAADGRVYLAQDWQTLFDLMFPVKLPAEALIEWMNNPSAAQPPKLPENWTWQNQEGRYRIVFLEQNTSGRIDLIPQTNF